MMAVVRSTEPSLNEETCMMAVVRSTESSLNEETYASLEEKIMRRIG